MEKKKKKAANSNNPGICQCHSQQISLPSVRLTLVKSSRGWGKYSHVEQHQVASDSEDTLDVRKSKDE